MRTTENKTHCPIDDWFLTHDELLRVVERYGTPIFVFDEQELRRKAEFLLQLFPAVHRQYFPVFLCPCRELLSILEEEGMGAFCQSPEELRLALECGFSGQRVIYGTTVLSDELAQLLRELDVTLQAASPLALGDAVPRRVELYCWVPRGRGAINSGLLHHPALGFSPEELTLHIPFLRQQGVEQITLALRYDGNVTEEAFLSRQLAALLKLQERLECAGCPADGIHAQGGLGVQYERIKSNALDPAAVAASVSGVMGERRLPVFMTQGTFLMEPCGVYVTSVTGVQRRDTPLIFVDSSADRVDLGVVGRYRHISISGKEWIEGRKTSSVYGTQPRQGDWFARSRVLPVAEKGDLLIVHDVGAGIADWDSVPVVLRRTDGTVSCLKAW